MSDTCTYTSLYKAAVLTVVLVSLLSSATSIKENAGTNDEIQVQVERPLDNWVKLKFHGFMDWINPFNNQTEPGKDTGQQGEPITIG